MRRTAIPLLLVLLAVGCRNTNSIEQLQPLPVADGDTVTILAPLATALTRTTLKDDAGTYNVYWALSDSIGVYSPATGNSRFILNETGISTVAFQGTISGTPQYAYYPYSATAGSNPSAVTLTLPAEQTQIGTTPDMTYDVKVGIKDGGDLATGYTFSFTQKLTLLHFIITPDATLDGEALQNVSLRVPGRKLAGDYTLDITAAGNAPVFGGSALDVVTLSFAGTPTLSEGTPVEGWMFINPDIPADSPLTIQVVTDEHRVTTTSATAAEAFVCGAIYEIALDVAALSAASKVSIELDEWYDLAGDIGLYSITPADYSALHRFEEYADQYSYATTSTGNYVFTLQGLRNGKLSRLTVASADLASEDPFTATLYTIYGTDGEVATPGTWRVVKRIGTKYWLEKEDGSQGFVLLKLED